MGTIPTPYLRKETTMHKMTISGPRQSRTGITAFLVGILIGALLGLRVVLIVRWRQADQAFLARIARFNKRWTNPVTMLFAGRPHSPYAVIHHVGRRSGQPYATPVITGPVPDGFVIPLAYGNAVDWYRNLQAAGGCTLDWRGKTYIVNAPELVDAATALPAFPPLWRSQLRLYRINRFVKVMHARQGLGDPMAWTEQRREPQPHSIGGERP